MSGVRTDNFKFDRFKELPISQLDVLVYAYRTTKPLVSDDVGNTELDTTELGEPYLSFYANVSKLDEFVSPIAGGVKEERMVELTARKIDVENIAINTLLKLDLETNDFFQIYHIMRHEYRFATILRAKLTTNVQGQL